MFLRDYEMETDATWEDCPFCGGRPTVDREDFYQELQVKNPGGAIVSVYCRKCDCELSEFESKHEPGISYQQMLSILQQKWNRRVEK